jgi:hypothetical protein
MRQELGEAAEQRAARLAREAQAARAQQQPVSPPPFQAVRDPLPLCIYTTVALLAWLFSPPLVVALFAALGLRAYWRAWNAGLRQSSCYLRDTRLVMAYLATLLLLGVGGVGYGLWRLLG